MTKKMWFGFAGWMLMGTFLYYAGKMSARYLDARRNPPVSERSINH